MRVYEAAKKHNQKAPEFVEILQKLGINKTNFHKLTEEEVKKIEEHFNKISKFPKIVRRSEDQPNKEIVVKERVYFNKDNNSKNKKFNYDNKKSGQNQDRKPNQGQNPNRPKKVWSKDQNLNQSTQQKPPFNKDKNSKPFKKEGGFNKDKPLSFDKRNKDFKQQPAQDPAIIAPATKNSKGKRIKNKKYEKEDHDRERELRTDYRQEVKKKKSKKSKIKDSEIVRPDGDNSIGMITVPKEITIKDLAEKLGIPSSKIIAKFFLEGKVLNINAILSFEEAEKIALDYDVIVEMISVAEKFNLDIKTKNDVKRAPIVTIMGHVDHGKTSLLDALRETNIIADEAGGITQSIGAYQVKINNDVITFIDTPGHQAFSEMRAKGANVTDIAILIVAADDGVKPQTIEAISHAKDAKVPIIVAINKIDKPGANPLKVKEELTKYGLVSTEWGGDTDFVEISAKQGTNLNKLLEVIVITAELLDLKADPTVRAKAVVLEAHLKPSMGAVADIIINEGTLKKNDIFVIGKEYGKVRKIINDLGQEVDRALPSQPVEIVGLNNTVSGGILYVVNNEKQAKKIAQEYLIQEQIEKTDTKKHISLEMLSKELQDQELKEIRCIIRTDTMGSNEALRAALDKLSNDEVVIKIIQSNTGSITESDVKLAEISKSIIIGFNVRPTVVAQKNAEKANIEIKTYNVIYNIIEDIENVIKGMLKVNYREIYQGRALVKQIFKVSNVGTIAGCLVEDGKVLRTSKVRVIRNETVIHTGEVVTLKRYKDDVKEATLGQECGILLKDFQEIHVDDIIETFDMEEIPR